MDVQSVITRTVRVAGGRLAPGHLGELTQQVPFDMVDEVLAATDRLQRRVRDLPSRVVVYLLLAGGLFAELGYRQVWARLVAGLDGLAVADPSSSGLAQARRRVGVAPLRALFDLVAGPAAGAARWRGLLVCAIDGTTMFVPDSEANLTLYRRQTGGRNGDSGYPMLRLLAVVACGTRSLLDAVFVPLRVGEVTAAPRLWRCLRAGMLLLADRNFAAAGLIAGAAATGADLLVRCKNGRSLTCIGRLPDGSWLSLVGGVRVRVIEAEIAVRVGPDARLHHTGRYRLITTLLDHRRYPATDIVELYHQRWEIETCYLELKSTILGGRVLRARTPIGIDQEIYALLVTYQALRTAITDATTSRPEIPPERASFSIALNTARDQLVHAASVIAESSIDLIGAIGRAVLADPLPPRRARLSPRIVKRAISKHRAKGNPDRTNHHATTSITIMAAPALTNDP